MVRGRGEGSIYRRPDGYWAASIELPVREYDAEGKPKRRRKVVVNKDKAVVIKRLRELTQQLAETGDMHSASKTVAGWLDYWIDNIAVKTRRPKTVASYRSIIAIVKPVIGPKKLDKLGPETIRGVFASMEAAGKSSTYMRNAHSVMSAAFKDAVRDGHMPRNPMERVEAPRKAVTDLDALSADEAIRLLKVFSESPEGALWATFILTGARRGEVLGLEWDRVGDVLDLSWQLQRITDGQEFPQGFERRHLVDGLYLTRPKTRAGWRVVPLVDPLLTILERYRAATPPNEYGLLFTKDGRPFDPDYVTKMWPRILDAAGIQKNVRVHDLRHTTVDLLYAAGVSEPDILDICGWSSRAMSRHYRSKRDVERLRTSMLQLSASLGN